jgi:alkanesulfonate monooxygenase SsuD/methylene tetrahydromethanopterin reductase-like flavin-dependent oxidoreductase (luciferase family)
MKIGITLPGLVPGTTGEQLLDWARRADAGPFSHVATGERLLWPGHDLMVTLAAAAAVTRRVRLISTGVVLPMHDAVAVAKQAATLDVLSGGRLTLGVGIGGRDDDYRALGRSFEKRHGRMEAQVAHLRSIFRGEGAGAGLAPVGPPPVQVGGPPILAGSIFPDAVRRVARWADGVTGWSLGPNAEAMAETWRILDEAWDEAGRAGRPYRLSGFWFALGNGAEETLRSFVQRYLSYFGDDLAHGTAVTVKTWNGQAITEALRAFAAIGTDEMTLVPVSNDPEQLDRLADLVAAL